MTFDSFPKKPQVVRESDGRISVFLGSAYQTMDLGAAMALHDAIDKVLAQSRSRVLTCVYCGHEYPQGTPAAGDAVLTDHIRVCEKHPMRGAEERVGKLRAALEYLVGVSSPDALRKMEKHLRELPAPDDDKAASINAIHVLLALAEGDRAAAVMGDDRDH